MLWCCPGEGDVPEPLVAALSSPSDKLHTHFCSHQSPSTPQVPLFPLSSSSMDSFLPILWRRVELPLSRAEISAAWPGLRRFFF